MFSRRRRGHYDSQQYNQGIRTPSAAAAANAFYSRQLGSSAAAEAIRKHSLDQAGANAMRDFQPNGPSTPGSTPGSRRVSTGASSAPRFTVPQRRANSMTSSSYQPVQPRSSPVTTPGRVNTAPRRTPSFSSYTSGYQGLGGGTNNPPRRNSLSSNRTNSLTRTHTVVNRDAQGRTLSLTTTTVRQLGGFELVSTKEMPLDGSALDDPIDELPPPPSASYGQGSGVAESIHSIESELRGIREEDEEMDDIQRHQLLARKELERESLRRRQAAAITPHRESADESLDFSDHREPAPLRSPPLKPAEDEDESDASESESEAEDEERHEYHGGSDVSDATPSPSSFKEKSAAPRTAFFQPETGGSSGASASRTESGGSGEPNQRDASPSRSALRRSGTTPKTKVSFGGADEEFIYESYEYDDEEDKKRPKGPAAAAAAAARGPSSHYGSPNPASSAPSRPLAVTQAPLNVQKRPSQSSLTGKSATPYPHRRPWDHSEYSDAPSSLPGIDVSSRSAARPVRSSQQFAHAQTQHAQNQQAAHAQYVAQLQAQQLAQQQQEMHANDTAYDGYLREYVANVRADVAHSNPPSRMRSLRDASSNAPTLRNGGPPNGRKGSFLNQQSPSIERRPSSRTLRTPATPGSAPSVSASAPNSPAPGVPTTPGGPSAAAISLANKLNQNPAASLYSNASSNSHASGGAPAELHAPPTNKFRTFSLRNTNRPDPNTLLNGSSHGYSGAVGGAGAADGGHSLAGHSLSGRGMGRSMGGGSSGKFKSRFADSDSDDDEGGHFMGGDKRVSEKRSVGGGNMNKISLGDVFSPQNDVKKLFKSRSSSESAAIPSHPSKPKKAGFFKKLFSKKEQI